MKEHISLRCLAICVGIVNLGLVCYSVGKGITPIRLYLALWEELKELRNFPALLLIFFLIGTAMLMKVLFSCVSTFYAYFCCTSPQLQEYRRGGVQAWAIVTGASAGYGPAYCKILLREGFSLLLIGFGQKQALNLAIDNPKLTVEEVGLDTTKAWVSADLELLQKAIGTKQIRLFVNNIGVEIKSERFLEIPDAKIRDAVNDSLISATTLTKVAITQMLPLAPLSCGIINVTGMPVRRLGDRKTLLSALNAFVSAMTRCVREENYGQNIDLLDVQPEPLTEGDRCVSANVLEDNALSQLRHLGRYPETCGSFRQFMRAKVHNLREWWAQ